VSKLCKIIDEELMEEHKRSWTLDDLEQAVRVLVTEKNTLFDDLVKNLEHNQDVSALIQDITLNDREVLFNALNPMIDIGVVYGIFRNDNGKVRIDNRLFEQVLYDYLSSKLETSRTAQIYSFRGNLVQSDNSLDMKSVLQKFQQFMKEQYSSKDADFLERNGRLLFLAFVKPIINGSGYDFKEPQISEERRLDIVITFNQFRYVVELKIWRGEKAHERGLKQLHGYLENLGLNEGYLLIFDTSANKVYTEEQISVDGKEIFVVRT
jgi:hypothetical protein